MSKIFKNQSLHFSGNFLPVLGVNHPASLPRTHGASHFLSGYGGPEFNFVLKKNDSLWKFLCETLDEKLEASAA